MNTAGQDTLSLLHDLSLLFLCLAHGADQELSVEERDMMLHRLRKWLPDQNPALIEHVIRDAALSYLGGLDEEHFEELVLRIKDRLDANLRQVVLTDLAEIAEADGVVRISEVQLLAHVQSIWTGSDLESKADSETST